MPEPSIQQIVEAATKTNWGPMNEKYRWFNGKFYAHRDLATMMTEIELVVRVDHHKRDVEGYIQHIQPRTVHSRVKLADRTLAMSKLPTTEIVVDSLRDLIRSIRPMLYEFDPRIGQKVSDDKPHLEEMFLFDPDGDPVIYTGQHCPLCGQGFGHTRPMWAGGNLRWAHLECWAKGLPKLPDAVEPFPRLR